MQISVIIPCHNAGLWIPEALQSVARQTLSAYETIVIDDDSSDDSVDQVKRSGVPVNMLRAAVRNAAAARNLGIQVAGGDWIALLDSDDVWYPNHLERASHLLQRASDVALLTNHDWIDLAGNVMPMPKAFQCMLSDPATGLTANDFFEISNTGFHFGHSTVLYRRERLMEVGMFDVSQQRRHDVDLWIRVIAGGTWAYDTVKSVGYREGTPGSLSKDEMECDYYYLRAITKNLDRIDCKAARRHLARQARRAMGIAFVNGSRKHYARIREIAWPHLGLAIKSFYRCGEVYPVALRALMRARRRITMPQSVGDSQGIQ
jgi:glycosyltransferase involved in cell wall biosynthesis